MFFLLRPRGKAGEGEAPLGAGTGPEQKPRVFFFCSGPGERQGKEKRRWAPARGQSKKINTTQGVCVFFYCGRRQGKEKLRWAPARGQSKKKKTPRVFFVAPAPGKGRGRRSPVGRRHGARAKKRTPPMVICFFGCGPGERQGKEKPRWAPARGQSKKKTPPRVCVFFFLAAAPAKGRGRRSLVGRRHGARAKKEKHPGCFCFFFLLRPRQKAGEGGRRDLSAGPEQKKTTTQGVFFGPAPLGGRGRRTARAFLFVLVLLFRAWCYWFLEFCLLSSSGVQSFFCCCAPLGASFLAGPEQKKHYPQYFDCCRGLCWVTPLFGTVAARVSLVSSSFLLLVSGVQECFVCRGRLGSDTFQRARKKNNRTTTLFLRAHGVFV